MSRVEADNKTIKDFATMCKAKDFSTYYSLAKQGAVKKSQQECNFPSIPTITKQFYLLEKISRAKLLISLS